MIMRALPVCLSLLLSTGASLAQDETAQPGFNEDTFKGLEMRAIGPAMVNPHRAERTNRAVFSRRK